MASGDNGGDSGGDNMRNANGHQCKVKVSGSEKKVNENTYDISSKKRVTKKFSVAHQDLQIRGEGGGGADHPDPEIMGGGAV